MISLDHTKRSDLVSCPRKYYLKYIRHIQTQNGSPALRYGIAWHGAMEGFYNVIAEKGWSAHPEAMRKGAELAQKEWVKESTKFNFNDEDYRNLPNLMRGFIQYLEHFHYDEGMLRIIEPEKVFKIAIMPTKFEQEKFPGVEPFYFTGKMDLNVELNGRPWIKEHKTTSRSISMQVNSLNRSPQVIGYNYAGKATSLLKEIPEGSLIVISQISAYKSRTTGKYGEPKFDFARTPQIFSAEDLANWRLSFVSDAYHLQQCIKHNCFPMRHHSCYTYGPCSFINLCEQNRPMGEEILQGFFIDPDPWEVTNLPEEEKHKLAVIEEKETEVLVWDGLQRKLHQM